MTKKEIAANLRKALTLMNDSGAHWIKGEYTETLEYDDDDNPIEVGYCSLGAIREVTNTDLWSGSEESNEVAFALAAVLPPYEAPGYVPFSPEAAAFDRIVAWNDDDDRAWNQVVEAFTQAAARLEQD